MDGNKIRNVVLLGHQSSGKTTLAEALFKTANLELKKTEALPDTQEGRLSIVPLTYKDYTINLIDVPGNDDFIGEAIEAVGVVKGAILVIDAVSGVEVGTLKHYRMLKKKNIPTIIFINKMDKENVHFEKVFNDIREKIGKNAIPFCYPMGHNEEFDGFINVVTLKARKYNGQFCEDAEIYDDKKSKVFELHNTMVEAVAQTSEELLDKFFSGETLTHEEIQAGLRTGVLSGELLPVLVGCALSNITIHTTLDMLIDYLPSPSDLNPIVGKDTSDNKVERKTTNDEPFSAYVFKTYVDSYAGVTSIFKINSGSLKVGDDVLIANTGKTFTVNQLFKICRAKQTNVQKLEAGDIGVVNKVEGLETMMTLCHPKSFIQYPKLDMPTPVYYRSLLAKNKNDDDKLSSVLAKLMLEDKTIEVKRNVETNQLLIGSLGTGHLNYILDRMKNAYKLDVLTGECKVVYKETIKGSAMGDGRYIKQSGGSGFYGVVAMEFSKAPTDENVFTEEVFGGAVPKNYFPAVEKGFYEACEKGLLAGFPVVGMKACLKDGKYHAVDSNELAFKMAAILAFKDAYMKCKPTILEPIIKIKVTVHTDDVGTILSDLNSRRARIVGMDANEAKDQEIVALIPESEILEYVNDLRSMTQGSGYFSREFDSYAELPKAMEQKLLDDLAKAQ